MELIRVRRRETKKKEMFDIFKVCADIEKKNKVGEFKLFINKIKSQVLIGSLDDIDDEEEIINSLDDIDDEEEEVVDFVVLDK